MALRIFTLFLFITAITTAQQTSNSFAHIDSYVKSCPKSVSNSIPALANYLAKECSNDLEKTRAIFVWIASNINYDDRGYNSGKFHSNTASEVFKRRSGVCEGYSNLFNELGNLMGLEVINVEGYVKGYSYRKGQHFKQTNHVWNLVKIENSWRIFDVTWGSGYGKTVNGRMKSVNEFDEFWFDVDPYENIFSHFPKNESYKLISEEIDLKTFEKIERPGNGFLAMGFNVRELFRKVMNNPSFQFPEWYDIPITIKASTIPMTLNLNKGKTYNFEFSSPKISHMALTTPANKWNFFNRKGDTFTLQYTPEKTGEVIISYTESSSRNGTYDSFLAYKVIK